MKTIALLSALALPLACAFGQTQMGEAQTTTTTVTQAADVKMQEGIVSEINPGSGVLKLTTDGSSIPMVFHFTEKTPVVDIKDAAFQLGNLQLGRVVTVHYLPTPGELAATRIVVGDAPTLLPAEAVTATGVEEKTTTTTTTTTGE